MRSATRTRKGHTRSILHATYTHTQCLAVSTRERESVRFALSHDNCCIHIYKYYCNVTHTHTHTHILSPVLFYNPLLTISSNNIFLVASYCAHHRHHIHRTHTQAHKYTLHTHTHTYTHARYVVTLQRLRSRVTIRATPPRTSMLCTRRRDLLPPPKQSSLCCGTFEPESLAPVLANAPTRKRRC